VVQAFGPERLGEIPARPETLRLVQQTLWGVVHEPKGTGWRARLDGVGIAGKTGTVQVIAHSPKGDKLPERLRDHGWFVAYAPVERPQLAMVIFGEHGGRGGSAYAPIARRIVEYAFNLPSTPPAQMPAVGRRHGNWGRTTGDATTPVRTRASQTRLDGGVPFASDGRSTTEGGTRCDVQP
jgi:penicillin-binding protein 2